MIDPFDACKNDILERLREAIYSGMPDYEAYELIHQVNLKINDMILDYQNDQIDNLV